MGDGVNQTGLQKDCTTGCVNVMCTMLPEVSTGGAYHFIDILYIYKYTAYFSRTTVLSHQYLSIKYLQFGAQDADDFKLPTLGR
jgi:hypothetical protein